MSLCLGWLDCPGKCMAQSWRTDKRTTAARGYGSRWQKARLTFLRANPLCVMCQERGQLTPATVVDHIIPHRGDQAIFWDSSAWQALCREHHNRDKQRLEVSGRVIGCDENGFPLDPNSHWRK